MGLREVFRRSPAPSLSAAPDPVPATGRGDSNAIGVAARQVPAAAVPAQQRPDEPLSAAAFRERATTYVRFGVDAFDAFVLAAAGVAPAEIVRLLGSAPEICPSLGDAGQVSQDLTVRLLLAREDRLSPDTAPAAGAGRGQRYPRQESGLLRGLSDGPPDAGTWHLGWQTTGGLRGLMRRTGLPGGLADKLAGQWLGPNDGSAQMLLPALWWRGLWPTHVVSGQGRPGAAAMAVLADEPGDLSPVQWLLDEDDRERRSIAAREKRIEGVRLASAVLLADVTEPDVRGALADVDAFVDERLVLALLAATRSRSATVALLRRTPPGNRARWQYGQALGSVWLPILVAADGQQQVAAALLSAGRDGDSTEWGALLGEGFDPARAAHLIAAGFSPAEAREPAVSAMSVNDLEALAGLSAR